MNLYEYAFFCVAGGYRQLPGAAGRGDAETPRHIRPNPGKSQTSSTCAARKTVLWQCNWRLSGRNGLGSLPLVPRIFGYPAGYAGRDAFFLSFPQERQLPGKREPYSATISTFFFIAAVV